MKSDNSDLLCSADDVFALAGVTDDDIKSNERERIERLISAEPTFLWRNGFAEHLRGKERQASAHVAHSVALKSGLISDRGHREVIQEALKYSQFDVGPYSHMVSKWLDRHWAKLAATASGIASFFILKGEFGHYDEVKEHLYSIHRNGGDIKVLKGKDNRADYIANDLADKRIPVRVHERTSPNVRFYVCDDEYLYFVSLPNKEFCGFSGNNPDVRATIMRVFEETWTSALERGTVA